MECVVLEFSDTDIELLADKIAPELFTVIFTRANRQYPWNKPLIPSMEILGQKVLEVALSRYYQRCN